ncbi:hypothetical protein CAAN3_26S00166 [[Candida] anglica]
MLMWHTSLLWYWLLSSTIAQVIPEPIENEPPSTIIDILSSQVEYSYFLRVLQRNGMIPVINQLQNITLLAPVNSAFAGVSSLNIDWDNNSLLRYILDQPVSTINLANESTVFNTLYDSNSYPLLISRDQQSLEYLIDQEAAIVELDVYAIHQNSYIQGIDKLLPHKPSMCDLLMSNDMVSINGHSILFIKSLLSSLFEKSTSIDKHKKKKDKKKKDDFPTSCDSFFNQTGTFFIPTDDYVLQSLTDLQYKYYTSLFQSNDSPHYDSTKQAEIDIKSSIIELLENLMLNDLVVGTNSSQHTSVNGQMVYNITTSKWSQTIALNGTIHSTSHASNLVLSDGVFHLFDIENNQPTSFFDSLNIPIASMTPMRALYAFHFSNVVEELYFRNLDYLVDGSSINQTILINIEDRDDVPDNEALSSSPISIESFSSKQTLLYQFLDEYIDISESPSHFLVDSKLCSKKRIGDCFKVKFSISQDDITINDVAQTIGYPIKTENHSIIYVTNREVPTPGSLKHSLVEIISNNDASKYFPHIDIDQHSCLELFSYLNRFDLFSLPDNGKGYSLFLPCGKPCVDSNKNSNSPWGELGLTLTHLQQNPTKLEQVLKGMIVKGTIYSNFNDDDKSYKNLNNDKYHVKDFGFAEDSGNHLIGLNETILSVPLNSDILFNQGVAHITSNMILPDDLTINISDLIKTTIHSSDEVSFLNLIEKYPKLANKLNLDGTSNESKFSLLVPNSETLLAYNITQSFDRLLDFLEFHLIPESELGSLLSCIDGDKSKIGNITSNEHIIKTNFSDTSLSCHQGNGKTYLQLRNMKDFSTLSYDKSHEVHIVSYGCTTSKRSDGNPQACVFLIDKPLNLNWLDKPSGNFLHVYLGMVSVGIGIVVGLIIFGLVMLGVAYCLERNNKQKQNVLSSDIFSTSNKPSYMDVRSSEEILSGYDGGYETDDDMLRSEHERLLPTYNKKKKKRNNEGYGSISDDLQPAEPRPINGKSIKSALNRERNLPSMF